MPSTSHLKGMYALAESENREVLLDYFEISRKRRTNRTALFKLQLHLFDDLQELEKGNKLWRKKVEEIKAKRALETSVSIEELEEAEGQLFAHRLYANAIRLVADGIVWRAFNYDRAALNVLSRASTKQQLTATGTAQEIREWGDRFSDNSVAVAILNSLTNWLALGDITVVKRDGSADIVEVKTGKSKSGRMQLQKHRMSKAVTLLGGGPGEFEGKPIEFRRIEGCPEHGLSDLYELLQEAEKQGWALSRLSNCLFVECVDLKTLDAIGRLDWPKEMEKKKVQAISDWYERGDFIVDDESHELLTFSPNYAPLSIFPFCSATCMDLMLGTKAYRSYLNVSALGREFEYRDWRILKRPHDFQREDLRDRLFQFEKSGCAMTLSTTSLARMQMEMVRPQTLIQEFEAIRGAGPISFPLGAMQHFVFDNECDMWN